jgi:predicted transcriptional regulator
LGIQETALVANHLVLSEWGIAGRRERESCKTGLRLSLSSLLKLLLLVNFGKCFVGLIFKSYSKGEQQIYSEATALFQGSYMRRSKMEMYISTLEALAYYGPLKITRITYKARMNCSQLKAILPDLIQKKLVEERPLKNNKVVYAATQKTRTALSYFNEFKEMLSVTE